MGRQATIGYLDVVLALSDALDLVSPLLVGHHKRVASIALAIAKEMEFSDKDRSRIVLAAALHDCGAFSLESRIDSLDFEIKNPHLHAEAGYQLLKIFKPLEPVAPLVRYHHLPWRNGEGRRQGDQTVPLGSHIIHLADRISILIDSILPVLEQKEEVVETINRYSRTMFHPDAVDALNSLSAFEYFWFDAVSPEITSILEEETNYEAIPLGTEEFKGLAKLFYRIIDFRSPFTSTHTSGVHACAVTLARHCGFSGEECDRIGMAACFHDLGKLAVPVEILEKRSPLSAMEQNVMRGHPYYGYRILDRFPAFRDVNRWANFHHERLDGKGYPFHVDGGSLPLGSRIMSVADIFTAVTEDRPYRSGIGGEKALEILDGMAGSGKLDNELVATARREYDELDTRRIEAQKAAASSYQSFSRSFAGKKASLHC